ncbi:hypothetical protein J4050_12100 [Winogradskyella sp. DF17]|uniref:Uncharacterized protein n=1 Tax=Winogradskyella pelagia TaxID=2819984 RepID=A0ABS3T430_9FLAO|nr:hypothetical protein [Winogradskyella sp. DF17]MBO3117496.1 hypothetical protein [Winogradskyella sp. DF17]
MDVQKLIDAWFLGKTRNITVYLVLLIVSSLAYIILQYSSIQNVTDSIFIGLLLGGTFVLILGVKWIQNYTSNNSIQFIEALSDFDHSFVTKLYRAVFNKSKVAIIGVGYGLLIGLSPFYFNLWDDNFKLNLFLCFFLFLVNFLTGASIYALSQLFILLYKTSKNIKAKIYDRTDITIRYVTELSKKMSVVAAFYVAFSMGSIYFSKYPLNSLIIGYGIFAAIVIVSAYIIPMIPIRNKIQKQKSKLKDEVSELLQQEFESMLTKAKNDQPISSEKYHSLLELRGKIANIPSLPVGMKTVWNSLSLFGITILPIIVQIILEKLFN